MKCYIKAFRDSSAYYFYIYPDDNKETRNVYNGRASSLSECQMYLNEFRKSYPDCVISIKDLDTNRWIYWKKSSV